MTTESRGAIDATAPQPALPAGSTEVLPEQVIYVKEPAHWFRRILVFVGSIGLLVALFFGLVLFKVIPEFHNPFSSQTTEKNSPVLLQSIKDMSKYVAAEGTFIGPVDIQQNVKYVPSFLYGKHTTFLGFGSVEAYVDFSKIQDSDIIVDQASKSVTINLPAPQLSAPNMDTANSYAIDQTEGIINHFSDLLGGSDPNDLNDLYNRSSAKIATAAQQSDLLDRAETNTRLMLDSLLKQLGFERVTINFPPKS
jgi:hypothetical protein